MKIDELKKIATENDYECTKTHGYYKFTRKDRGNYVVCKFGNRKQTRGSFPSSFDDKDFNMKKAAIEFGKTFS